MKTGRAYNTYLLVCKSGQYLFEWETQGTTLTDQRVHDGYGQISTNES
jgi:hypothetical protein